MIEINKNQHKQITVHEKICAIEARLYHIEKQHEVTQKLLLELLGALKNGSFEIDTIDGGTLLLTIGDGRIESLEMDGGTKNDRLC